MDSIRPTVLRRLFNLPESDLALLEIDPNSDPAVPQQTNDVEVASESMHSAMADIAHDLRQIAERLDVLCVSSFNVLTLSFLPGSQSSFTPEPPTISNCEQFLGTLTPTTPSNRSFMYKIRSLQALAVDLGRLQLECSARNVSNTLVSECENVMNCIHADLQKLLFAAWETGQQLEQLIKEHSGLGVHRFEYARPNSTGYHLVPIATATIILTTIIHCLMGVSRDSCNFILRYIRSILLLVNDMHETRSLAYLISNIQKIPLTLETSLRFLDLQADLDLYVVCPKCSTLYDESKDVPDHCTASSIDGTLCQTSLFNSRHRGTSSWQKPQRRYSHQRFEVWLSRFLNRPGIEELIEGTRPALHATMTDFWDAPYLNNFPGLGQPSFFDTSVENLRLAFLVYHDFFNPFSNKMAGKQSSVGVVFMVCLNLPPDIRYNRENLYAVSMIPGPSEPSGADINHFMRPIVQNLLQHYDPGVWVARTHKYPNGRHVRSAAVVESMDLMASRQWSGLGPPTHTFLCSCCWVTQEKIDQFSVTFKERTHSEHLAQVQQWRDATTSTQRGLLWKRNAARHSEMLAFEWWSPFVASTIAPMHWSRNVLEKQLRENMGWSWQISTGIPVCAKVAKPVSTLGIQWGNAALQYLSVDEFVKSKLTEPILRHLCNEKGLFNTGLPSRRMIDDLNAWRQKQNLVNDQGSPVQTLPENWGTFNRVSVAKSEFYLSKAKEPGYLLRNSHAGDLRNLCLQFELESTGTHAILAARLLEYYKPYKTEDISIPTPKAKDAVAILGKEILSEIKADMSRTTIPSWIKAPPKNFGTASHGKIGAEEYKSLALISLTISLIRLWSDESKGFRRYLDHFLHLTVAIRVLAYQSITKSDIDTFAHHYSIYLDGLKELYPYSSITPVQHLGLHIPSFLENLGPATRFNENPGEMFIGMLQEIPTNWKFGELETTLHKELIMVSNLQGLLLQSSITKALGDIGPITENFLSSRFPETTELLGRSWAPSTDASEPMVLNQELYDCMVRAFTSRRKPLPARAQIQCSKIQHGHLIYQPMTASAGNSGILFEYPGALDRVYAGRIESIFLTPASTNGLQRITILARVFKPLDPHDLQHDPFHSHQLIGESGYAITRMYYNALDWGIAYVLEPKDIISHIATCVYEDEQSVFSAQCVVVLSLDLKHKRPG